ncbi:Ly-6 protein HOT-5 [Trichostrongylus colubriformis]|uniref:Ly-6 protein HOT-5 n=1 Tax=Trichostrongylus colubriformis TaxID=6319 RepID=A0AAN8FUB2_TRICO
MNWIILSLIVTTAKGCVAIKCYSCASSEYQPIFEKSEMLAGSSSIPQFDRFCDIEDSVQAIAPVESCESSCITIFEPQYFGGLQSPHRPYLFLRGCAARLLSAMESPPREVDFLHRAAICVSLPLSQIYPKVYTNEVVEACSCVTNGCNYRVDPNSSTPLCFYIVVFTAIMALLL